MILKWYPGKKAKLTNDVKMALLDAADAVLADVIMKQTLPFAEDSDENRAAGIVPGYLQEQTFVDRVPEDPTKASVVSSTPYARRLYYHPEFNFYRGENTSAGGLWWDPYVKDRRAFVTKVFRQALALRRSR